MKILLIDCNIHRHYWWTLHSRHTHTPCIFDLTNNSRIHFLHISIDSGYLYTKIDCKFFWRDEFSLEYIYLLLNCYLSWWILKSIENWRGKKSAEIKTENQLLKIARLTKPLLLLVLVCSRAIIIPFMTNSVCGVSDGMTSIKLINFQFRQRTPKIIAIWFEFSFDLNIFIEFFLRQSLEGILKMCIRV